MTETTLEKPTGITFADPMEQGSDEWHAYRATKRNASEAPAVMGENAFFPHTPYELFQVRTGIAEVRENKSMRAGKLYEEEAREYFEAQLGEPFQPHVVEQDIYSASLDGVDFDGRIGLEIKIPEAGLGSPTAKKVIDESQPGHYYAQAQHQIMTGNLAGVWFGVYDRHAKAGVMIWVAPDQAYIEALFAAWDAFAAKLEAGEAPDLTERDTVEREDLEWAAAAERVKDAKQAVDAANAEYNAAKAALEALADHPKTKGCGVTLTRVVKKGSVKYADACKDNGLDVEPYRGEPSVTNQVRVN